MPLIPEISIVEFRKLKVPEIKQMKSCTVMADGEILFIAIIPPQGGGMAVNDNIKTQAEYLGLRANTVGGKEPAELIENK